RLSFPAAPGNAARDLATEKPLRALARRGFLGRSKSKEYRNHLPLVGLSPDAHLLGGSDQLVPELGVSDGDDLLGALPGVQALEVDHAVLGDQVLHGGTGVGADGAVGQGG